MRDAAEVLVLDVVRYSRMFDRDLRGPGDSRPVLDRWTINLTTGAVTTECRDDRPQVGGHRLVEGEQRKAAVVNLDVQRVERPVAAHHMLDDGVVAFDETFD